MDRIISAGGMDMRNRCDRYDEESGRCRRDKCAYGNDAIFPICRRWSPELDAAVKLKGGPVC